MTWPRVEIRKVAKLGTGHTPSRSVEEYWVDCDIPWLTLADVGRLRDGTVSVVSDTKEKISPLGVANSAAVIHPAGTVAMSRTASVGYSCILGTDMATSQDYVTWTCGPRLLPRFLLWVRRGERTQIIGRMQGSTHKTIYMPDIESMTVPLPDTTAQEAIADFLDTETARVDTVITKKQVLLRSLNERLAAEIDSLVGLEIRWSQSGPLCASDEPVVKLGLVTEIQSGLTLDGGRLITDDAKSFPYLRVANVQDGRLDLSDVKEVTVPTALPRRCLLRPGDVLMTEGGDPDKLGRGTIWRGEIDPCLHQNHVFAVRPSPQLRSDYLALLTRSSYARAYFEATASKTTGIASTSTAKIAAFRIPLPTTENQARIAELWEQRSRLLTKAISRLTRQIELLLERKQALITAAVTGQLDIPGVAV